jgi:hypothetical protein
MQKFKTNIERTESRKQNIGKQKQPQKLKSEKIISKRKHRKGTNLENKLQKS